MLNLNFVKQIRGERRVRVRGTGPREGREGEEWFLIKRRVGGPTRERTGDGDRRREPRSMTPRM